MASAPGNRADRVRLRWAGRGAGKTTGRVNVNGRGVDENRGSMWDQLTKILAAGIEVNIMVRTARDQYPASCDKCGWIAYYRTPYEARRAKQLHDQSCGGIDWIRDMHSDKREGE